MPETRSRTVCLGVIVGAHGVKGEVRIRAFTERALDVGAYGPLQGEPGGRSIAITRSRLAKDAVVATIEGVSDRSAAEGLKGVSLTLPRDALPPLEEETYYHADLVGLRVEDRTGGALGEVVAVHDFGGGDILEIATEEGKRVMLAFTKETVPGIDLEKGRLIADPPRGVFEDEKEGRDDEKA